MNYADIGIDLGTASVLVYIRGKGVVLKEPSVVAFDRDTNKIKAIGEDARTIEDVCEPFLLQAGLLQRTPRGRKVSPETYRHLGYKTKHSDSIQQNLF